MTADRWRILMVAVAATVLLTPIFLIYVMATRAWWPRSNPWMRQIKKYSEIARQVEPIPGFTELLHLPLDDLESLPTDFLGRNTAIDVDPAQSSDGRGSVRITASSRSAELHIASVLLSDLRRGESSLTLEAMVLEGDLHGRNWLSLQPHPTTTSGAELDVPRFRSSDWIRRQAAYFVGEKEDLERVDLFLYLDGPGTLWIDQVRLLNGPAWRGYNEWQSISRERLSVQTPPTPEEVRSYLTSGQFKLQARMLRRIEALSMVPGEVQQAVIEAYLDQHRLAHEKPQEEFTFLDSVAYRLIGPSRDLPLKYQILLLEWHAHDYYQPLLLDDLLAEAPDPKLVETYGVSLVPLLPQHANHFLDTDRRSGYTRTVARLLVEERIGRLALSAADKRRVARLVQAEWERIGDDERMDSVTPVPRKSRYPIQDLMTCCAAVAIEGQRRDLLAASVQRLKTRRSKYEQIREIGHLASMKLAHADEVFQALREVESDPVVRGYLEQLISGSEGALFGARIDPPDDLWRSTRRAEPWQISQVDPDSPWRFEVAPGPPP